MGELVACGSAADQPASPSANGPDGIGFGGLGVPVVPEVTTLVIEGFGDDEQVFRAVLRRNRFKTDLQRGHRGRVRAGGRCR